MTNTSDPLVPQQTVVSAAPLAAMPSGVKDADSVIPAVQRFGSDEHKKLGDEASGGATLELDIGDPSHPLTYGDMVALAGDYFESIEQIKSFATPANPDGQDQIRWARWDKLHTGVPGPIREDIKIQVRNRFYMLSAKNASHFSGGGTARNEYERVHQQALGVAFKAGASGNAAEWSEAMATEAFSNHYLTDMFSAGHVRTPRKEIQAWYQAQYPDSIGRIVTYITDRLTTSLKSYGDIPWYWPDSSVKAKVRVKVEDLGGPALAAYTLGDIISLAFHNQDNKGLNVISDVDPSGKEVPGGYAWTALGDDHLAKSPITQQMAEAAVKASLQDLSMVREAGQQAGEGRCLPPEEMETALRASIAGVQPFLAEKYIPREGAGNVSMEWKWGALDPVLRAAVDETVKGEIVGILRTQHPADMVLNWKGDEDATGSNHLHISKAFTELCDHLAADGVKVLEAAMNVPARYPEGSQEAMDAGIVGPPAPPSPVPVPTPAMAQ